MLLDESEIIGLKRQIITTIFKNVVDGFRWTLTSVFELNDNMVRASYWEVLQTIYQQNALLWCIGVDFNAICFSHEKGEMLN